MTELGPIEIAAVCHEANRMLQTILGDPISPSWFRLDTETKRSAIDGVANAVASPTTPEQSHANWSAFKREHGWTYGPVKDLEAKTHPCLVPYAELPADQRVKDKLFLAIVAALTEET